MTRRVRPMASTTSSTCSIVGSGGGGMTAALTADASGLDALVVEKSASFGGSTALSGGGIWVPGAPAQRREGYVPDPDSVVEYLRQITDGLVSEARIRQYVESSPQMLEFLERLSPVAGVRLEAGLCRLLPGIARRLRTRQHDQRAADRPAQAGRGRGQLLKPLALAPKGIWLGPKELRSFYRVRQSWAGKGVLVKLIARMVRARVFGERIAAIGQSLAARLRLAMREREIPLWLNAPMAELLTDADGSVTGALVERDGTQQRVGARAKGSSWPPADSTTTWSGARSSCRCVDQDWSFGNPASMGDGIRAGEGWAPRPSCSTRPGGSRRSNGRTAECNSCSTNG